MTPGIRHIVGAAALMAATVLSGGCTAPGSSVAVDINASGWDNTETLVLRNTDTVSLRNLNFFVSCNELFREDTLTVRIGIRTPDRGWFEEHFRLSIPHTTAPAALRREAVIPYRRQVRFPVRGDYHLYITPVRTVRGIEAAGISIEKSI